jgi:hypothetical protein
LWNSTEPTPSGKITLSIQGFNNVAFKPSDQVTLYANVTYNDAPLANIPVAFQIIGAVNTTYPLTLFRTQQTNNNGIANITFIIPSFNDDAEDSILGTWQAYATTKINGDPIKDALTFQVKSLAEDTSIRNLAIALIVIAGFLTFILLAIFLRKRKTKNSAGRARSNTRTRAYKTRKLKSKITRS